MLFRKKIVKSCGYCVHGVVLDDGSVLCSKKGARTPEQKCFRFRYDPCKRVPVKAKAFDFSAYKDADYSL